VLVESPIVIDVWTVEPEQQEQLVAAISANLQRLVVGRPGFIAAEIYQSANRDLVLLNLHMRSAQDRQALTDSPELHAVYRELGNIATSHRHVYRLVESFGAPPAGPAD
jgi:heme-degrading monooxygenase HmoA